MVDDSQTTTLFGAGAKTRAAYVARINRAIDHIERNLGGSLNLEEIARQACFSPYHFHRVFGAIVGETVGEFVRRVRIERAASLLLRHPQRSVTEIALDCGFSSPAVFARGFRTAFGTSPTEWRAAGCQPLDYPRCKPIDVVDAQYGVAAWSIDAASGRSRWRIRCPEHDDVLVEEQELPPWHVAYVRHTGSYQGMAEVFAALFRQLLGWATPRGLLVPHARLLAVYHDDPGVTDHDKLRVSVCLTVPEGTVVGGEIGAMTIPGGRYAMGHFMLGEREYARAWHAMMAGWLPESGFEPDDRPCFELYRSDSAANADGKCSTTLCIPVRPLGL